MTTARAWIDAALGAGLTDLTSQQVDLVGWMVDHGETLDDLLLHDDLRVAEIVDALSAHGLLVVEWWRDEVYNMSGGYANAAVDELFDALPEHARRIFTELAFRVAER